VGVCNDPNTVVRKPDWGSTTPNAPQKQQRDKKSGVRLHFILLVLTFDEHRA
jgi:hypothetical protein